MRLVPHVLGIAIALAAGCAGPGQAPDVPTVNVSIYIRNVSAADAWFIVLPLQDPPFTMVIPPAQRLGANCGPIPVGSAMFITDGPPRLDGSNTVREVFRVRPGQPQAYWIDVEGQPQFARTGVGLPEWWKTDPQTC